MEQIEKYLDRLCLELKAPPVETGELRAELAVHLYEKVQACRDRGLSEDESVEKALAEFGSVRTIGGELARGTRRGFRRLLLRRLLQVAGVAGFFFCLLAYLYWRALLGQDFMRDYDPVPYFGRLPFIAALVVVGALALDLPRLVFQDEHRPFRSDRITLLIFGLPGLMLALGPLWFGLVLPWVYDHVAANLVNPVVRVMMTGSPLYHLSGAVVLGLALAGGLHDASRIPYRRLLQIAGVCLFALSLYGYERVTRGLGLLTNYEQAVWTAAAALLLVLGVVALNLPRWVRLVRKKDRVLSFDSATLLIHAVPGLTLILLPLISYHFQGTHLIQQVIGWLTINCLIDYYCFMGALVVGVGITNAVRSWERSSGRPLPGPKPRPAPPTVPVG